MVAFPGFGGFGYYLNFYFRRLWGPPVSGCLTGADDGCSLPHISKACMSFAHLPEEDIALPFFTFFL